MTPDLALSDPAQSAVAAALSWLEGVLLGSAATMIAVIAIAWIGVLMVTGRIDLRRAAQVVMGCFIIFGASAISDGIRGAISGSGGPTELIAPPPILPPPVSVTAGPVSAYDPHAGASLPRQ